MPDEFRVLITGAGTTTAVSALKGLRMAGDPSVRVLMGDLHRECAGAHLGDEFVQMPAARDADFQGKITAICHERRVNLVFPIIDYEFSGWSRAAADLLKQGTRVAISELEALRICQEKDHTYSYFTKIGAPTIPTWWASKVKDPAALPYPVHLKPRCGRASHDLFVAYNPSEFDYATKKVQDLLVQPFIKGTEVTIDTISDFDGKFLAASPRVRVEVKGGQAYRSRTMASPELVDYAKRIVEGLPIIGPANIQLFLTDEGPKFFEINPRFGAGTILSIQAGMNGPNALAQLARGRPLRPLEAKPDVLMLRYWEEVFV